MAGIRMVVVGRVVVVVGLEDGCQGAGWLVVWWWWWWWWWG